MNNFMLILLVALAIGEVSGGMQAGAPPQPAPAAMPENLQDSNLPVFAALSIAVIAITVAALQRYLR